MLPKSDVGSSSIVAQVVDGAPSCTSITTRSTPAVLSVSASALTALTMSVTSIEAMPAGETSSGRCSVTAPTKPTLTSSAVPMLKVLTQVGSSAGLPEAFIFTLAARYFQVAPPSGLVGDSGFITRLTRSS